MMSSRGQGNILRLCVKEWRSLWRDRALLFLLLFIFSFSIYSQGKDTSMELRNAAVGIVDEDHSALSLRFRDSLLPPYFGTVESVDARDVDKKMEEAQYTFVLHFPDHMEEDLRAGKPVTAQLLADASVIGQAGIGIGYVQKIIQDELQEYFKARGAAPVNLVVRHLYNQGQVHAWFMSVALLIQDITMLSVVLTGAALLRERESGTIEHLLVMPVTPLEIALSKTLANGAVILILSFLSLQLVVRGLIGVHVNGSVLLFMTSAALYLFFTAGLGIFLGTLASNMPQFGLLFILSILPMNLLSGGFTPLESMPPALQTIMKLVPSTNFTSMSQAILFRGAGIDVVWPQMLNITTVGLVLFIFGMSRFRSFLERQG